MRSPAGHVACERPASLPEQRRRLIVPRTSAIAVTSTSGARRSARRWSNQRRPARAVWPTRWWSLPGTFTSAAGTSRISFAGSSGEISPPGIRPHITCCCSRRPSEPTTAFRQQLPRTYPSRDPTTDKLSRGVFRHTLRRTSRYREPRARVRAGVRLRSVDAKRTRPCRGPWQRDPLHPARDDVVAIELPFDVNDALPSRQRSSARPRQERPGNSASSAFTSRAGSPGHAAVRLRRAPVRPTRSSTRSAVSGRHLSWRPATSTPGSVPARSGTASGRGVSGYAADRQSCHLELRVRARRAARPRVRATASRDYRRPPGRRPVRLRSLSADRDGCSFVTATSQRDRILRRCTCLQRFPPHRRSPRRVGRSRGRHGQPRCGGDASIGAAADVDRLRGDCRERWLASGRVWDARFGRSLRRVTSSNRGERAAALNAGIRAASGRYLAFLTVGDRWRPDFLQAQRAFLAANPLCDLVYCDSNTLTR